MGIGNFNSSKRLVWAGCLRESGPAVLNLVNECGQEIRMKRRIDRHKDGSNQGQGSRQSTRCWRDIGSGLEKTAPKCAQDILRMAQVGEWTTCDAKGKVVKITKMGSSAT
jgi:hypothetical protein